MKQFWHNLTERDRLVLVIGGGICLVFLLFILIISPLKEAVTQNALQLDEKLTTLGWMKQMEKQHRSSHALQAVSEAQLLNVLSQQLRDASFHRYPYQLQQLSGGEVQLSFEQVPFNASLVWLKALTEHYAVEIKQLHATKTEVAGVVNLLVILHATPAPNTRP